MVRPFSPAAAAVALLVGASQGCFLVRAHDEAKMLERSALLRGEVRSPSTDRKPIVVALFREHEGRKVVLSYSVRYGSGPFQFQVGEGRFFLFAIEDENESLAWEDGEPVAWYGGQKAEVIEAEAARERDDLMIELDRAVPEGTDELRQMVARGPAGNPELVAIHAGDVVGLDEARFSDENGRRGLWTPIEFLRDFGFGVYFLEPYDPKRIPVLFVHGAGGAPAAFGKIVEHLDRQRFQPWVLHWPSGIRLGYAADYMRSVLDDVRSKTRFSRVVIVAHSMGGLLARACINQLVERGDAGWIAAFVTISTPWHGHALAEMGTSQSPIVIPSWLDMIPESPFLDRLLAMPLPAEVPHHLFFSFEGGSGSDGTVSLASQLAPRAQEGATAIYGFAEDHVGILSSADLARKLDAVLAAVPSLD